MKTEKYKGKGKGSNPNSKAALSKRTKGAPPVPGAGRPKGALSFKDRLTKFLEMSLDEIEMKIESPLGFIKDKNVLDNLICIMIKKGLLGDMVAMKEILERNFGKETQPIDLMTKEKIETTVSMEERIQKYVK